LNQDGQSDPRQLVGKRDGQNVAMQTPRRSREPGSKTVLDRNLYGAIPQIDRSLPATVPPAALVTATKVVRVSNIDQNLANPKRIMVKSPPRPGIYR